MRALLEHTHVSTLLHKSLRGASPQPKSRSELPADPQTVTRETPRGPYSVSAKIEKDPKPPILVDGLLVHTESPALAQPRVDHDPF